MVTKSKDTGVKKKGKVKVDKLNLNKETVKDLTSREKKEIKGAAPARDTLATALCTLRIPC